MKASSAKGKSKQQSVQALHSSVVLQHAKQQMPALQVRFSCPQAHLSGGYESNSSSEIACPQVNP